MKSTKNVWKLIKWISFVYNYFAIIILYYNYYSNLLIFIISLIVAYPNIWVLIKTLHDTWNMKHETWIFISTSMIFDCHCCIGNVWNKSENICTSYKIFSAYIYCRNHKRVCKQSIKDYINKCLICLKWLFMLYI